MKENKTLKDEVPLHTRLICSRSHHSTFQISTNLFPKLHEIDIQFNLFNRYLILELPYSVNNNMREKEEESSEVCQLITFT